MIIIICVHIANAFHSVILRKKRVIQCLKNVADFYSLKYSVLILRAAIILLEFFYLIDSGCNIDTAATHFFLYIDIYF